MIRRFILSILLLIVGSVSAQTHVILTNDNKLEIEEHNLWFKTRALDTAPGFIEITQSYQTGYQAPSTLGGSGAYIAKIRISNRLENRTTQFVNLQSNYLDIGTAYWQSDDGQIIALENFGQVENRAPKLSHSQTFSLIINKGDSGFLWIYIQAKKFATPVVVKFFDKATFYHDQFFINSITTIAFTVMITLALIACLIYIRTRYLVTLACAGYIGLHGLGWLVASGSLGHLINAASFNPVYLGIMIFPFAIASASQYTKLLFNCRQEHIKLNNLFNLVSLISVALGVLMPLFSFDFSYLISHLIATIWIPLCIGTGVFMLTKQDFRAKYYLAGNLLYGIALAVYLLSHRYHLDADIFPELIVQVALAIDCVCILLSLVEWLQIQQKEYRRNYAVSRIDPLTKIGNRFAQNEFFANLKGGYCITFIDFDGFKAINDALGHDEGDRFLIAAVRIMQQKLADLGSIFRCGGDEFIWVVGVESSQQVDSFFITLSDIMLNTEQELKHLGWDDAGLSFGIATSFESVNQSACLSLADKRMYQCKKAKKNNGQVAV
ncbi:sensor domain-containing diguanylate cyclase [Psychromonas marina]|nr:diguanylate cyclase [Psychromonas marina]